MSWDIDKNNKYEFMLNKKSHSDNVNELLTDFLKKLIRFVHDKFGIELEFNGKLSIS